MTDDLLLEARNITRCYPGGPALRSVTFRVHRGEVNVLIGENGAGKSTLMRILAGVETPDEGSIILDGAPVTIRSPREAAAHGIAIVHQELAVMPNLNVSDNVFAGRELVKGGAIVDRSREDAGTNAALARLRHLIPAQTETSSLSLGSRQIVELARAVAHGARLLILDEPTSALSIPEAESLFHVLAEMKAAGVTIIYISHRLHELLHLGDHFTVLRSGEVVGECSRDTVTREWIVERMSGRGPSPDQTPRPAEPPQPALLELRNLSLHGSASRGAAPVRNVCFTVRTGEIVGIYGLLGAGRTELLEALAGARRLDGGEILLRNKSLHLRSISDAMRAGIVLVPEDRQRDGLIPELSIRENIALTASLSRGQEQQRVRQLIQELRIAARDIELPVAALSGGNQQKVLLARCLMHSPVLLLLDEPTRGVDVNAKADIYATLRELAARGLTILFTSSEIEETRLLADRALVLCQGVIAAEYNRDQLTDELLFASASPKVTAPLNPDLQGAAA